MTGDKTSDFITGLALFPVYDWHIVRIYNIYQRRKRQMSTNVGLSQPNV